MRWLTQGEISQQAIEALVRHGHSATAAAALVPPIDDPAELLATAHQKQLDVLTSDSRLADSPFESPAPFDRSIVLLAVGGDPDDQAAAVDRLFARYKRLSARRLYTVSKNRVKVRQLPGA